MGLHRLNDQAIQAKPILAAPGTLVRKDMKLIKNAIVYRVDLPSNDDLTKNLEELPFVPLGETMLGSSGFVPNRGTGELVTPIAGGLAISMRYDEKIIPESAVRARVDEKAAEINREEGRTLRRKERAEIRDVILAEMARVAFEKTAYVDAFYYRQEGYLIVATGSKSLASMLTGLLVRAVGSIKSQTINVSDLKQGITTRLRNWIDGIENMQGTAQFGPFGVGSHVQMKGLSGERLSIQMEESVSEAKEAVAEALASGFMVERIALDHGPVSFRLTSDFHLKSISIDAADEPEDDDMDAAGYWRHEAGAQLALVADVISNLCDLCGYVPPEEHAASES